MSLEVQVLVLKYSIILFGITMVLSVTLFPIIFNFWIIPQIEKKIGKKLEYGLLIYRQCYWCGRWGSYLEIAQYIVLKYCGWKRKLSPRRELVIAKYRISLASRSEIIMSFLAMLNIALFLLAALVGSIYVYGYPQVYNLFLSQVN